MPENENQPGETPAPAGQSSTPPNPAPETGPDGKPFDAARAMSTIEALRAEIKGLKGTQKERDELAAKVKEFEQAQLSETEKLNAQLADQTARANDLQSKYQGALIRAAVVNEATKQGAVDADVVFALVDRAGLELQDDGTVKGADKAVKTLLDAKPYLVAQQTGGTRSTPKTPPANGQPQTQQEKVKQYEQRLAGSGRYAPL